MFLLLADSERPEEILDAAFIGYRSSGVTTPRGRAVFKALDELREKRKLRMDDPRLARIRRNVKLAAIGDRVDESDAELLFLAVDALLAGYDGTPNILIETSTFASGKSAASYAGQKFYGAASRTTTHRLLKHLVGMSGKKLTIAPDVRDDVVYLEANKVPYEQVLDVFLEKRGLTRKTTATEILVSVAKRARR